MKSWISRKISFFLAGFALIICLNNCSGEENLSKECKAAYKEAMTLLNTYYKSKEQLLLEKSLSSVEQAMKCDETRRKAIYIKLGLLTLMNRYQQGQAFTDSLIVEDFTAGYKKGMTHDFFLAKEYETKGDTINRDKLFNRIIDDIRQYIEQENVPANKINEEAYYDLIFFKRKLLSDNQLNAEIELLKQQYPDHQAFFNALKETFQQYKSADQL